MITQIKTLEKGKRLLERALSELKHQNTSIASKNTEQESLISNLNDKTARLEKRLEIAEKI
ncbi:hypothetical protein HK100_002469 [Physocladia obscura]|uniref:Uncharacterized protein n=1 Tax=Physocladia obscura TaxID=109957 RepID=A0AAD5XFE7_9FUNG|nr:hypothetical protein HK100_002469 [Physocladia obscura]